MRRHGLKTVLQVLMFLIIAIAGFGEAVHHLWNWLMPELFHLPLITFWQGVGLLALSWVLFGGWRGFRGPGRGRGAHWRHQMSERWERMSPEERAKFREGMRGGCGRSGRRPEETKA